MNENLQAIIDLNRQRQKNAQALNIRAGQNILPVLSKSELTNWLVQQLGGAVSAATIVNVEGLRLPELDEALVEKIVSDNPDQIAVDNEVLPIVYGKDYYDRYYAKTNVSETLVRNTKLEFVKLPGGRQVSLICGSHSAETFLELFKKLEQSRIETAWVNMRREQEHTSWISNPSEVYSFLPKLLTAVEVIEGIFGYISLYSDSDPDFQIRLRESKEDAEKETTVGLERLLRKSLKEVLVVPQEEPFQSKGSYSWSVTDIGEALKKGFDNLVVTKFEDLNSVNIFSRIEEVKVEAEKIKIEIGGKYVEVEGLIAKTEVEIETKVKSIDYDDRDFVFAEISQAREMLSEAKKSLKNLAYADAKMSCGLAIISLTNLEGLINVRSVARNEAKEAKKVSKPLYDIVNGYDPYQNRSEEERNEASSLHRLIDDVYDNAKYDEVVLLAEQAKLLVSKVETAIAEREKAFWKAYPEAFAQAVGNSRETARKAIAFAEAAVSVDDNQAFYILKTEYESGYGRDRRQSAISINLYGIADTEGGQYYLSCYRASDADAILGGAVEYLRTKTTSQKKGEKVVIKNNNSEASFAPQGKRYFKCSCGYQNRISKGENQDYESGKTLTITCSGCGASGEIKK